jgi:hypothetical protein
MHTVVRSPLVAAATLVGAGVIAISPVTPVMPDVSAQVHLSAATRRLLNPVDVFAPVFESALLSTGALINDVISSPTPILQTVLLNQNAYAITLGRGGLNAGVALSDAAWATPGSIVLATQQAIQGDAQGALATLHDGIVVPLADAVNDIVTPMQQVLQSQLYIAQQLVTVVPEAAMGVVMATINSFQEVTAAAVDAGSAVANAVATLNPVVVANAITDGAANVAQVFVNTTIGSTKIARADASLAAGPSDGSIAQAFLDGRQNIADAISVRTKAQATATVAQAVTTTAAAPTTAGPAKSSAGTTHATKAAGAKRHAGKSSK